VLLSPRGEKDRQAHVEQGQRPYGRELPAQAAEAPCARRGRDQDRGAKGGPGQHQRGRRDAADRDPDQQERAAPDQRGGNEQKHCPAAHAVMPRAPQRS